MQRKRAILLTENEKPFFRYDVNINRDFIEYDLFNALSDMDKAGIINLKKLFNMIKVKYGLSVSDKIDVYKEFITNGENWKIIPLEINEVKE